MRRSLAGQNGSILTKSKASHSQRRIRQRGRQIVVGINRSGGLKLLLCALILLVIFHWVGVQKGRLMQGNTKKRVGNYQFHQQTLPHHLSSDDGCSDYGCPTYPPEFETIASDMKDIDVLLKSSLEVPLANKMATLTRMSNRHPRINQDAALIIRPFRTKQTTLETDFLVAIFDGHGRNGHFVSRFVRRAIPHLLATKLNSRDDPQDDEWIVNALNDSFVESDLMTPPMNAMLGGSTASVTLRRGNKLFIANTGDSRTIVATPSSIKYMTRLDKAHLPEEQRRIEAFGGSVKYPAGKPQQSRVWVYSTAARETIGLAMSRSLGDWEWGAVGVIADPIVNVVELDWNESALLLAASDGMWDMRPRPQFFAKKFFLDGEQHPLKYCHDVIETISPKNDTWYRDDISIVVMKL